jgi:hypothetical protein
LKSAEASTLFTSQQPVPHVLYLAHETLLALAGDATLEIKFEMAPGNVNSNFDIIWEFWDGEVWRRFTKLSDGTAGLQHSGVVRLQATCAQAAETTVNDITARWIRGRLNGPLPPQAGMTLPFVDSIKLRSVIKRPKSGEGCVSDLQPDQALAEGRQVDLSRAFRPLGGNPQPGAAFYFSSEELFSKPGAKVTVCFRRPPTLEEEADAIASEFEQAVELTRANLIKAATIAANTVIAAAAELASITSTPISTIAVASARDRLGDTSFLNSLWERIVHLKAQIDGVADAIRAAVPITTAPIGAPDPYGERVRQLHRTVQIAVGDLGTMEEGDEKGVEQILEALTDRGADSIDGLGPAAIEAALRGEEIFRPTAPILVWEYWNGRKWQSLNVTENEAGATHFFPSDPTEPVTAANGKITFIVPDNLVPVEVERVEGRWIRVRLAVGTYTYLRIINWRNPETGYSNFIAIPEARPPVLESFFLGYTYRSPQEFPEKCLAYNDFNYAEHTDVVRTIGNAFFPYQPVADKVPTLYLGFDRSLPSDLVSFYWDIPHQKEKRASAIVWEAWDGQAWEELIVTDETASLTQSGILSLIPPDMPLLPRFGTPRAWLRARRKEAGEPFVQTVTDIHLNAVWAGQQQTFENEVLGSSTGHADQVFFLLHTPILPEEEIEVLELTGKRADVEFAMLQEELLRAGMPVTAVRTVTDARTNTISQVWVRWQSRPHLYFSGPEDRHYVLERSRGRLRFGDGSRGMIPPPLPNGILARRYRSGGGQYGNVVAGSINQLLGFAPQAQGCRNVRNAEGGADGETAADALARGPFAVRHRWAAVAAQDYEKMALEASPAVAFAQARPTSRPGVQHASGWVTVVIVPHSRERLPKPSLELRRIVRRYLLARSPAGLAGLEVVSPKYVQIGVNLTFTPLIGEEIGKVERRLRDALERYFHPIGGGRHGLGWPFGRDIHLSDVAAVVEAVPGVDFVTDLMLTLAGSPQNEYVAVPSDRIVAPGEFDIRVKPHNQGRRF